MLERLEDFEREFADVEARLADSRCVRRSGASYAALARRHKELDAIVATGRRLRDRTGDLGAAREMVTEAER